MFIASTHQVEQHIAQLEAEATAARMARAAHPAHPGHSAVREFVASVVTSARVALEPLIPTQSAPTYRS